MKEMILLLADTMPEDTIIDQLRKAANAYLETRDKSHKLELILMATLFMSKQAIEATSMPELLKRLQQSDELQKLFNKREN